MKALKPQISENPLGLDSEISEPREEEGKNVRRR
jgi:hypothetical protein